MNEKINKIINLSVESINEDLNLNLSNLDDTEIIGGNSPLDSLGVLSFVMELEKNIEEILGLEISLVNDDFLSNDSPLKNISELKIHLVKILKIS